MSVGVCEFSRSSNVRNSVTQYIMICLSRVLYKSLNNSEIDLPEGHDVVVDDGEVDLGESMEAAEQEELKWTDKGIDLLLQREGGAHPSGN